MDKPLTQRVHQRLKRVFKKAPKAKSNAREHQNSQFFDTTRPLGQPLMSAVARRLFGPSRTKSVEQHLTVDDNRRLISPVTFITQTEPVRQAMKKPKTKAQVRNEIDQHVRDYLNRGGEVSQHPQGASNRELGIHPFKSPPAEKPTEARTPVADEIAAIESRRKAKTKDKPLRPKQPRKILITDDFGQPLRWVWEDEIEKP